MEAKTYTKRENARRAGVAAGVPAELVEITVHKNGDEVRFGWKAMEAPAPAADAVVTTSKPKKAAVPKVERIEQNGVKRPKEGGLCAAVWAWLDAHPGRNDQGREGGGIGERLEREQRGLRVLRLAQVQRDADRRQRALTHQSGAAGRIPALLC